MNAHWACPCGWEIWTDEGAGAIKKIRKLHLRSGHRPVRLVDGVWKVLPPTRIAGVTDKELAEAFKVEDKP